MVLLNPDEDTPQITDLFGFTGEEHLGKTFYFPKKHKPGTGDARWKHLWLDICLAARNSGGAELCVTSSSEQKGSDWL